jgi:hypothetical protein
MSGFEVDTFALSANAAAHQKVADQVGTVHSALHATLGTIAWRSNDQAGAEFAKSYEPNEQAVLGQLGSIKDALDSGASGVDQWGYSYDSAESSVRDSIA